MNPNSPSQTDVSQRAYEIWEAEGRRYGRDHEDWLSAERQVSSATAERIKSETAAESIVEYHISPAVSDDDAVKAALQPKPASGPNPALKPKPPSNPAVPVRGSGQSQSSATRSADPKPAAPTPGQVPAPRPPSPKAR